MYAIVEIQGQQFKAEAGKFLYVHYLGDEKKEGETLTKVKWFPCHTANSGNRA